jgi:hypothetical protein
MITSFVVTSRAGIKQLGARDHKNHKNPKISDFYRICARLSFFFVGSSYFFWFTDDDNRSLSVACSFVITNATDI